MIPRRSSVKIASDLTRTYESPEEIAKIVKMAQEVDKRKKKMENERTKKEVKEATKETKADISTGHRFVNVPGRARRRFTLPVRGMPPQHIVGGKPSKPKKPPVKTIPIPTPPPPPEAKENLERMVKEAQKIVKPPTGTIISEPRITIPPKPSSISIGTAISVTTEEGAKIVSTKPSTRPPMQFGKPASQPRGLPSVANVGGKPSRTPPKGRGHINPNARVPDSVKRRVIQQLRKWYKSLPGYVREELDLSGDIEAVRMAGTVGELQRTIEMINSEVRYVALRKAKEKALKYFNKIPSDVKEILEANGLLDTYINKVKHARSVEELNSVMKEFAEKANDAVARVNVSLGKHFRKWFKDNIIAKFEEYKSFELSKEKVLKWLESLPTQVKEAMGSKYKELEEKIRGAKTAKELQEAVEEANKEAEESAIKVERVTARSMAMLYPELNKSIVAKWLKTEELEGTKEKIMDYLQSLPPEIRARVDLAELELGVTKAKSLKDLAKVVEEINKQVKGAYSELVRGQASIAGSTATLGPIPATAGVTHAATVEAERWTRFTGFAGKPQISKEGEEKLKEWADKVASTLIAVDPSLYQKFREKYGKDLKALTHTKDPTKANVLAAKIAEGANQLLLSYYKEKIAKELEGHKGKLSPMVRTAYSSTIDEFVNAVKKAKNLAELREVVNKYNTKLKEVGIIVGRGLENLEVPDVTTVWTQPNIKTASGEYPSTLLPSERGKTIGEMISPSLASQAISQLHITNISISPQSQEEGSIEMFKTFHPTSLENVILQWAIEQPGDIWHAPIKEGAATLAGFIGATVGAFNPETYYGMYKLAVNPEYRSEFLKSMGKFASDHPGEFASWLRGMAAGTVLMGLATKGVFGETPKGEIGVQEFEPWVRINWGKPASRNTIEIGRWKTVAKIPKEEVLEFKKGGVFLRGPGGKLTIRAFKGPANAEYSFNINFEGVPESAFPEWLRLGGKLGAGKMKYILPRLGEPIATEAKGLIYENPVNVTNIGAFELARPTGKLSKVFGGRVFRAVVGTSDNIYKYGEILTMKGYKFPFKLGAIVAKWRAFEGELPGVEVRFEGGEGAKPTGLEIPKGGTPEAEARGFEIPIEGASEAKGVEIPIEGVEGEVPKGTTVPAETEGFEVPITFEEGVEAQSSFKGVEGKVSAGVEESKTVEAGTGKQVTKLIMKEAEKGKGIELNQMVRPHIRLVEEPGFITPAFIAGSAIAPISAITLMSPGIETGGAEVSVSTLPGIVVKGGKTTEISPIRLTSVEYGGREVVPPEILTKQFKLTLEYPTYRTRGIVTKGETRVSEEFMIPPMIRFSLQPPELGKGRVKGMQIPKPIIISEGERGEATTPIPEMIQRMWNERFEGRYRKIMSYPKPKVTEVGESGMAPIHLPSASSINLSSGTPSSGGEYSPPSQVEIQEVTPIEIEGVVPEVPPPETPPPNIPPNIPPTITSEEFPRRLWVWWYTTYGGIGRRRQRNRYVREVLMI